MTDTPLDRAVIIDDDEDLRNLTAEVLQQIGYETYVAPDGETGVATVQQYTPTLVCVDIQMPGIDGFETVRRIRETSRALVVMLTGKDTEMDIIQALGMGADDYMVKPIRPREFRARVDALRRRSQTEVPSAHALDVDVSTTLLPRGSIEHKDSAGGTATATAVAVAVEPEAPTSVEDGWLESNGLKLNSLSRVVTVKDEMVALTRTEFDLLHILMQSGRRVRSKADLALHLRGDSYVTNYFVTDSDKRAVEVHITNLRRKIGDQSSQPRWIETVRGVGYRMTA